MTHEQINELRADVGGRRLVTQLRERALLDDDVRRATRLLVEFEQQAAQIGNDRARTDAA